MEVPSETYQSPRDKSAGAGMLVSPPGHFYQNTRWRLASTGIWLAFELAILGVVVAFGVSASPHFLTGPSLLGISPSILMVGLMAPAMVMIVASGGVDLSIGGVAALAGVVTAMVMPSAGVGVGILVGLSAALGVGLVNAVLVSVARIHSAFVTLVTAALARALAMVVCEGMTQRASEMPESQWPFWLVWMVVALGSIWLVQFTPFALRPAPEDKTESRFQRAVYVGAPYLLSSLTAGLVGIVIVGHLSAASPNAGIGLELEVVLAVLLGGTCFAGRYGCVVGALIGVLIAPLLHLAIMMAGAAAWWGQITVTGGVLVLAGLGRGYHYAVDCAYRRSRARMAAAGQTIADL